MVLYQSSKLVLSFPKHFGNTDKYTDIYTQISVYLCVLISNLKSNAGKTGRKNVTFSGIHIQFVRLIIY